MTGTHRFHWGPGTGLIPYGLWRLPDARERGFITLVEGESDCHVLWHHGIPAVGVPGAATWRNDWAAYFAGIKIIYVVIEPDSGGETLLTKLGTSPLRDRIRVIRLENHTDPLDLHRADPEPFPEVWRAAMAAAALLSDLVSASEASNTIACHLDRVGSIAEDASEDEVIEWLRRLFEGVRDPVVRAGLRQAAINELKHVDRITAPARSVDPVMAESEAATTVSDVLQGSGVHLPDPEPWEEPVVGTELLDQLRAVLTRYLVLPPKADVAIALWIVFAHGHDAWVISTILSIVSATKRCGETTLLMLLSGVVPRPLPTSNITPAALFRIVEACAPTLLIDEADTFFRNREELRGIVNSGHRRDVAYVIRTAGDDHEPRHFRTWSPKAIAQIGRPPETVIDRSIVIVMQRRAPNEPVESLRLDRVHELEPPRRQAWRWAQDHLDELRQADPEVPVTLGDREADNWRPLLAIADAAGGDWPALARAAALGLAADEEDDAPVVQLLADIKAIFRRRDDDRISSADLLLELHRLAESPWEEWRNGKPLSAVQLAKLLKPFGAKPKALWFQLRDGNPKNLRGYELSAFMDAFRRYLPDDDPQGPQGA